MRILCRGVQRLITCRFSSASGICVASRSCSSVSVSACHPPTRRHSLGVSRSTTRCARRRLAGRWVRGPPSSYLVEEDEDAHLVGADAQLVPPAAEVGLDVRAAHAGLPRHLAARVLVQVEGLEGLTARRYVWRQAAAPQATRHTLASLSVCVFACHVDWCRACRLTDSHAWWHALGGPVALGEHAHVQLNAAQLVLHPHHQHPTASQHQGPIPPAA